MMVGKKRRTLGDAIREAWSKPDRVTMWERQILNRGPRMPPSQAEMDRIHGGMLDTSERQEIKQEITARERASLGSFEWWKAFRSIAPGDLNEIKYDLRSQGLEGERAEWLTEHGYGPGKYPPPSEDPYNRLDQLFRVWSVPAKHKFKRFSRRTGEVYYIGENAWAWRKFMEILRTDYDLNIARGRDRSFFNWAWFRETYDSKKG